MINQSILPELKQESASTRKMLSSVPLEQKDWKPHEKSMALGRLANHVADILNWIPFVLQSEEFNLQHNARQRFNADSKEQLLQGYDQIVQSATESLQKASDEDLLKPWTMRNGEKVIFTLPRMAAVRTIAMNHLLHHRGQLSVYLRLLNVKVPGMYGPSADEAMP